MDNEPRVLVLPSHVEYDSSIDPDNLTDDQDIAYNQHCVDLITAALREEQAAGKEPVIKTQYPLDTTEPGNDSRDIVGLTGSGEVIILDSGVR